MMLCTSHVSLFFFNDTATTEIYTLSLHDALPIFGIDARVIEPGCGDGHKTRKLLRGLERPSSYVGIDIAHEQLARFTADLRRDMPRRRRSEEHTSELQSQSNLVCRLLLEKKKKHE